MGRGGSIMSRIVKATSISRFSPSYVLSHSHPPSLLSLSHTPILTRTLSFYFTHLLSHLIPLCPLSFFLFLSLSLSSLFFLFSTVFHLVQHSFPSKKYDPCLRGVFNETEQIKPQLTTYCHDGQVSWEKRRLFPLDEKTSLN